MIIFNEPIKDYHSNEAIGSGDVRAFLRSPQFYKDKRDGISTTKESPALAFGSACHLFFLEPDRYSSEAIVKPVGHDGRTKEGKAWAEAHALKTVISREDWTTLLRMRDRMPKEVRDILSVDGKAEVTYRTSIDGVLCQCRTDWQLLDPDGGMHVFDLKTTQDVDEAAKSVWQYGYHIQDQFYRRVIHTETGKWPTFTFVFCETQAPYRWRICTLDSSLLLDADAKINRALEGIAECQRTGDWSDRSPITQTLFAPKWAGITESEPTGLIARG